MNEREHELLKTDLTPFELPTEGEWKRAVTDRKVMEEAFMNHEADPKSDTVSISYPLRGERFIAVPRGATVISFSFPINSSRVSN